MKRQWITTLTQEREKRTSELCKAKDIRSEWYKRWCIELKETPNYHRKQWEFIYILQSLWERGCIGKGKKGLVFAVGNEPLPSLIANYGTEVLATDIFPDQGIEKGWTHSNQLCFGVETLNTRGLCPSHLFEKNVSYKAVDMNHIPDELTGFDFNWSSCSFEHLGSIELGIQFLINQLNTLKPGGWAVHTTEYNVSSNDETQDNNETVIFRQQDIDKVVGELLKLGHFVEPLDYSMGGLPEDFEVDIFPHKQKVHLKIQVDKYVVTSFGLIIRKNKDEG